MVAELGQVYERVERQFNDAAWVGFRLSAPLHIAMPDKQALLEMTDPRQRLRVLARLIQTQET